MRALLKSYLVSGGVWRGGGVIGPLHTCQLAPAWNEASALTYELGLVTWASTSEPGLLTWTSTSESCTLPFASHFKRSSGASEGGIVAVQSVHHSSVNRCSLFSPGARCCLVLLLSRVKELDRIHKALRGP